MGIGSRLLDLLGRRRRVVQVIYHHLGELEKEKMDHGTLKVDHGALNVDHGALNADHGTLKVDHGALKVDLGVVRTDQAMEEVDHVAAKAGHVEGKVDRVVAMANHVVVKADHVEEKVDCVEEKGGHVEEKVGYVKEKAYHMEDEADHVEKVDHVVLRADHGMVKADLVEETVTGNSSSCIPNHPFGNRTLVLRISYHSPYGICSHVSCTHDKRQAALEEEEIGVLAFHIAYHNVCDNQIRNSCTRGNRYGAWTAVAGLEGLSRE